MNSLANNRKLRPGVVKTRLFRWSLVFGALIFLFFCIFSILYWADVKFFILNGEESNGLDDFLLEGSKHQLSQHESEHIAKVLSKQREQSLDPAAIDGAAPDLLTLSTQATHTNLRQNMDAGGSGIVRTESRRDGLYFADIDGSRPYSVQFRITLEGNVTATNVVLLTFDIFPEWAPLGAKRFLELIQNKFYDNSRFFRVIKDFVAQFGIAGLPETHKKWSKKAILDDPVLHGNDKGTLVFATSGKDSRTCQIFINLRNNKFLDKQGFAAIGKIVQGEEYLDRIFNGYGEGGNGDGTDGKGPGQGRASNRGNAYLDALFPRLAQIVEITAWQK